MVKLVLRTVHKNLGKGDEFCCKWLAELRISKKISNLKELCDSEIDRYEMAIITDSFRAVFNCRQKEKESLQDYTRRFKTAKEVLESHIGGPVRLNKDEMLSNHSYDKPKLKKFLYRSLKSKKNVIAVGYGEQMSFKKSKQRQVGKPKTRNIAINSRLERTTLQLCSVRYDKPRPIRQ